MLSCDGARLSAADVLSRWKVDNVDLNDDFDSIPCLNAPSAICELILRGRWKDLISLARWEHWYCRAQLLRPFGDWPDPAWMAVDPTDLFTNVRERPSMETVVELRDVVRQAAGKLTDDDRDACLDLLSTVVERLNVWEQTLAEESGELRSTVKGSKHVMFSSMSLLESLRLCRRLKSGGRRLGFAVERAAKILSPYAEHDVNVSRLVPSYATMQRAELSLDVAIMLERSNTWEGHIRYMWMDASPQNNFDWIWAEFEEIRVDVLLEVFDAVVSMSAYVGSLTDVPEEPTNKS